MRPLSEQPHLESYCKVLTSPVPLSVVWPQKSLSFPSQKQEETLDSFLFLTSNTKNIHSCQIYLLNIFKSVFALHPTNNAYIHLLWHGHLHNCSPCLLPCLLSTQSSKEQRGSHLPLFDTLQLLPILKNIKSKLFSKTPKALYDATPVHPTDFSLWPEHTAFFYSSVLLHILFPLPRISLCFLVFLEKNIILFL